jgi:hypothetical protein
MSGEVLPSVLKVISNRVRRNTIQFLNEEKLTYLELLISCGLNPERHCGWFDYHLGVLLDEGVVTKEGDQYLLTEFGTGIARLLQTIEGESHRLFQKEVTTLKKEEAAVVKQKIPTIIMKEIPDGKLTISLDHRQPLWWQGERRTYRETARIPPEMEKPWGRNNYLVDTCLERTCFPKKEEYHYIRLWEVYTSKYDEDGTEENRSIVQRTEEGYFLDSWVKHWEVQKPDGLYDTKRVSWSIRGKTEPEEELLDPPEKSNTYFPLALKAGQKGSEGPIRFIDEREVTATREWEVIGEYRIKIDRDSYECLLKREFWTYLYSGKMGPNMPQFVNDAYFAKGLTMVLMRRWDRPVFIKRLGYKNWENSSKLEYKAETYYLTSEHYLAERYIPIVNLGRTKDP